MAPLRLLWRLYHMIRYIYWSAKWASFLKLWRCITAINQNERARFYSRKRNTKSYPVGWSVSPSVGPSRCWNSCQKAILAISLPLLTRTQLILSRIRPCWMCVRSCRRMLTCMHAHMCMLMCMHATDLVITNKFLNKWETRWMDSWLFSRRIE